MPPWGTWTRSVCGAGRCGVDGGACLNVLATLAEAGADDISLRFLECSSRTQAPTRV